MEMTGKRVAEPEKRRVEFSGKWESKIKERKKKKSKIFLN
jgi:hypothetical protein